MPTSTPLPLPASEIYIEIAPGIRYYKLLRFLQEIPRHLSNRPYIDEMDQILKQMYSLQTTAAELEAQGKISQAIAVYEIVTQAQFDNPHSYIRLCQLYHDMDKPKKVVTICNRYLHMAQNLKELGFGDPRRDLIAETFMEMALENMEREVRSKLSIMGSNKDASLVGLNQSDACQGV